MVMYTMIATLEHFHFNINTVYLSRACLDDRCPVGTFAFQLIASAGVALRARFTQLYMRLIVPKRVCSTVCTVQITPEHTTMNAPENSTQVRTEQRNALASTRRGIAIVGSAIALVTALIAGAAAALEHGSGRHHGWGGPMAHEAMTDHLEHHIKYMLSEIDATAEQRTQITSIIEAAERDVHAMHDQDAAGHRQFRETLLAASVDRARLETLRAEHLRMADAASKRLLTALADSADVLTAEQRSALASKIEEHHRHRRGNED